ncbi:MAG: CPBP family intramembrane metalloprotease [Candidatus Bathyarchaeota archaeon]|nr:CPBP family intramembrane metalloprotease [Candidatus Bathyarchaeota archaeon]MDW8022363.1 CPBP family intramembrane glutamic endopeptidase [Nitrososphaerota archaeon]
MKVEIEWQYLVTTALIAFFSVYGWHRKIVSDIHALFALGGCILMLYIFIAFHVEISSMNVGNFLLQNALLMGILGFPSLVNPYPRMLGAPHPIAVLIGIAAEEVIRIAVFYMVLAGFNMPRFAVAASAITFAALHLYWYPTEWFSAIIAGALFSISMLYLGSPTACVTAHFIYDLLAFAYISTQVYFLIFLINLIIGLALTLRKVKVKI